MSDERNVISSLVVDIDPKKQERLVKAINELEGAEVAEQTEGTLIVLIDRETIDESSDQALTITQMDGVLSANLAYLNFEDEVL